VTELWHTMTPPQGSFAVLAIEATAAGVYAGWSSVALWDLTTGPESMFSPEEAALLAALFERYAMYADAQLAPDLFPRPAHAFDLVDPIPDLLVPRVVAALIDTLTTILRTREDPP
jgi:hypothetical protein